MKLFRAIFFLILILGIGVLIGVFKQEKIEPTFSRSFAPFFQELGKPIKSMDRTISRLYPVYEIDEEMLGREIKSRLATELQPSTSDEEVIVNYLNALIGFLTRESNKPFSYQVFLMNGSPNACAFPGGAICVTKGMLDLLDSEAELVAILGHEIGHIERGHLFDSFRNEMLLRKINDLSILTYATTVFDEILHITFSKTQEDEADEFGFRMLVTMGYDPFALGRSFEKILENHSHDATDPLTDFFNSHPHTKLRSDKFRSRALLWTATFPNKIFYEGKKNWATRVPFFELAFPDEWIGESR